RIAPHATRAARMAATMFPLTLLAAACTAALPASRPGALSAQPRAPSAPPRAAPAPPGPPRARPAAPPARPALPGAPPCPDLPRFTCSYLTVPLDRSGKVPGTL